MAHSEEDVSLGLLTLALNAGSSRKAAKNLSVQGYSITEGTLRYWREKYPERYHEIQSTKLKEIENLIIASGYESVIKADELEKEALALEMSRTRGKKIPDAARTAKNAAEVKRINLERIAALQGKPTRIIEHRNGDELLAGLARLGLVVDSTATEEPIAQIPAATEVNEPSDE